MQGDYPLAVKIYEALMARYPFAAETRQSRLDVIYAYYRAGESESAIDAADTFIRENPTHPRIDYAWYLKGLTDFERMPNFMERWFRVDLNQRPPTEARRSFTAFATVVEQFPESDYAHDARRRMVYLRNRLADYEIAVARYYVGRGAYVAAAQRAKVAIEEFDGAPAVREALEIMTSATTRWSSRSSPRSPHDVPAKLRGRDAGTRNRAPEAEVVQIVAGDLRAWVSARSARMRRSAARMRSDACSSTAAADDRIADGAWERRRSTVLLSRIGSLQWKRGGVRIRQARSRQDCAHAGRVRRSNLAVSNSRTSRPAGCSRAIIIAIIRRGSATHPRARPSLAGSSAPVGALPSIPTGDRITPVAAKGAPTHPHSRRGLASLLFIALHEIEHAPDGRTIESARADLIHRQILFDERFEDRIEHLVWRQRIAVFLIGSQLCEGGRSITRRGITGAMAFPTVLRYSAKRYTSSLLQSLMGANPPAMSPYNVA